MFSVRGQLENDLGDMGLSSQQINPNYQPFRGSEFRSNRKTLKKYHFKFIHPIKERSWKQKVLKFYDYDKIS